MNEHTTRLLIYSVPLIFGTLIAVLSSNVLNSFIEAIEAKIRRWQINNQYSSGVIPKWVIRPILYVLVAFHNWTDHFKHRGLKNGLRITISSYFIAIALILAFWIAVYIIACILIFYVSIFIISYARSKEGLNGNGFNFGTQLFSKGGSSRKRRTLIGDEYLEYYDSFGRIVGKSEIQRSIVGNEYVQYYDANGRKVGTSEIREKFVGGAYTQFYDENETTIGTSEKMETLVGEKFIQHYDEEGKKTGQSIDRRDYLGQERREYK